MSTEHPEHIEINFKDEKKTELFIVAEPHRSIRLNKYDWLIQIKNKNNNESNDVKVWAAMAQKIAHDIKNPLTNIQLTLQRLQQKYKELDKVNSKTYDSYTSKIFDRIESLRRMSRDFMKFLNIEDPNFQKTNINTFIDTVISGSLLEIPDDTKLEKHYSLQNPDIKIDQEQMQTLIENLISNAINAMPDGGTLTISTSLATGLHLECNDFNKSDFVIIECLDTGTGIPDEIKDKLFQPFVSKSYLGTGLGLAIVKKIVEDHSGHIEISSEKDSGTSVCVYVPLS